MLSFLSYLHGMHHFKSPTAVSVAILFHFSVTYSVTISNSGINFAVIKSGWVVHWFCDLMCTPRSTS